MNIKNDPFPEEISRERIKTIRTEFADYDDDIKLGMIFGTVTVGEFKSLLRLALRMRRWDLGRENDWSAAEPPPRGQ